MNASLDHFSSSPASQSKSAKVIKLFSALDALTTETDQTVGELTALLPSNVLENVSMFVEKAQASQDSKGKERQT